MRELFTHPYQLVEAGVTVSGVATRSQTLHVVSGSLWVTIEGDAHDYWLSTGDALNIAGGRLVVLEGERQDCRVRLAQRPDSKLAALLGACRHTLARRLQHAFGCRARDAGLSNEATTCGCC